MIYEALRALLIADTDVQAAVAGRVYAMRMPDNPSKPSVVMQVVGSQHLTALSGSSGLASPLVQLDCYAATIAAARDLAEDVRLVLQGYRGTSAGVVIKGVTEWQDSDLYDDDISIYLVSCLCRVWHSEAKPA